MCALVPGLSWAGLIFRDTGDGINLAEVGNVQQFLVRLDRLANADVGLNDQSTDGRFQLDGLAVDFPPDGFRPGP